MQYVHGGAALMRWTARFASAAVGVAWTFSLADASAANERSTNEWPGLLDLRRACGPEREVELTAGSVSVHIQFRWLRAMSGSSKQLDGTCPTKPVTFNILILDTRGLGNPIGLDELGMRFVYLRFGRLTEQDIDRFHSAKDQIVSVPSVKEVTNEVFPGRRQDSNAGVYDVHYASSAPQSIARTRFSCAGIVGQPGGRGCRTVYPFNFQGLNVDYSFRSKEPGRPRDPVRSDVWAAPDPEIIVAVDSGVRRWIEGLRKPRAGGPP